MKKVFGALFLIVVTAGLAWLGWQIQGRMEEMKKETAKGPRGTPAVAVALAPVTRGTVRDVGVFSGTLSAKSRFEVAPKVAGRVKRILVNIGEAVKKDQLIAVLDDEELRQQAEQSRAELDMARANVEDAKSAVDVARSAVEVARSTVEVARKEFERLSILKLKGIASVADLDVAEAKLKASDANLAAGDANVKAAEARQRVAEAQVNQRDAARKAAEIRLSYAQVRAEWQEGSEERVVGERFVDEGALLKANDPIISILENDVMTAVLFVIERDYPKVKVGQDATVLADAYPERPFSGKIVRIAAVVREASRQARVEIEVPNPERLLLKGNFVRAQIEFSRHDDATLIPVSALVKRGDRQGVFLADVAAKKATFVPLTLGIVSGKQVEVIEPALSGQVVVMGQHLLDDGGAISLPETGKEPGPAEGPSDKAPAKARGTRAGAGT